MWRRRPLTTAAVLFLLSAIVSVAAKQWHGYIDLQVYRNGARVWLDGGDLYGPMPQVYGLGLPFTYPPLAALFFAPLALMHLAAAETVVLLSSLAALGVTLWVVSDRLRPELDPRARLALIVALMALIDLLEPVRQTFNFGQINLVLLAAITLDALVRKPFWPRGMLIGIAVSVKLIPAGYLLYFLLRKDWKAAATLVVSAAGAIGLGFLLFPKDSSSYWFHTLWDTDRIGPPSFAGNQSLKGFAFRLGTSDSTATLIWAALSLATVALAAVWMMRLLERQQTVAALLVNAAAVLLVSPVSWSHHWVWVGPALLVGVDLIARRRTAGLPARGLTAGVGSLTVLFAIGPHWLLPHSRNREAGWSLWEQLVGSSYVLVTFAIVVLAALSHQAQGGRPAWSRSAAASGR
ncbi:DUF2029 domain-containing protein [Nocardia stercoris]|uniref:DUF2029 domain-containing protein n=1 Tax=Nocardia stercoris TaxID=2483361 RepID=A0A3M2KZ53_9NOCA|nr:DUF2029 domain-containing protein [Nocardia stercoris]